MEENSISTLVDAKTQFLKQLSELLTINILEGFNSIYDEAYKLKQETYDPRMSDYSDLQIFQDLLRKIPKWNQDIIDRENLRIKKNTSFEHLDSLIKAVILSNLKVMAIVKESYPKDFILNNIPNSSQFIHRCYVQCARKFFENPYLFDNDLSTYKKQVALKIKNDIINQAIEEVIRKSLPWEYILEDKVTQENHDEEEIKKGVEEYFKESENIEEKEVLNNEEKDILKNEEEEIINNEEEIINNEEEIIKNEEEEIIKNEEEKILKNEEEEILKNEEEEILKNEEKEVKDELLLSQKMINDIEEKNNVEQQQVKKKKFKKFRIIRHKNIHMKKNKDFNFFDNAKNDSDSD